jgi:catechol 2,3-dioxygenase-like lactoylglutathione lyase family enzyme
MIGFMLGALVALASPSAGEPRIASVEIVVRDLAAERAFYVRALGFRDAGGATIAGERIAHLALGEQRVDLVRYDRPGAAISAGARSDDRDFQHVAIIVSDMPRAWAHVEGFPIRPVSTAPQTLPRWNPAAGGIAAVYFRDPEGHPLELLHFPPGKGEVPWHAAHPLFLGIDHTAIGVADPRASARFYEGLGLTIRGHSDNYGIEQARLSGVPGAHVAITAVRFAAAPGVEFLHYVAPVRPQPLESARPNDLVSTRTQVIEPDAAAVCARFAVVLHATGGCLIRDPDGHLVDVRSH